MYGTVSRVLVGRRQTGRTFVFNIGVCLNLKVLFVFDVVAIYEGAGAISPVHIHYYNNGDDVCTFIIFVECMERCCVGCVRTASTFVSVCVSI